MSAFEFFFSFYGLLLGLSVAELVGGFARVLHERQRVRFGWLTPLLAVFVAMDVATFWAQAWTIFQGAPFSLSLLFVGLVGAATFYVAASVTFPRVTAEGVGDRIDLDQHFWAHRRLVFTCVLAANLIVAGLFSALMSVNPAFAEMSSPRLWIGMAIFVLGTGTAAFSPWRPAVMGALVVLVAYSVFNIIRSASALVAAGGWSPPG
jgi:hypothetical protein